MVDSRCRPFEDDACGRERKERGGCLNGQTPRMDTPPLDSSVLY